jgi:hypothetical protein
MRFATTSKQKKAKATLPRTQKFVSSTQVASRAPGSSCRPPSQLGWRGDPPRAAVCRGSSRPGRGGPGRAGQGRGPRRAEPGSGYQRGAGSSPRLRRSARPALLSRAPPAPPRSQPPPPPPAPPRSLIDGSLKKSPRSCAASAGERRHSCNPSAPPGRRSAPARSAAELPGAAPPPAHPRRAHPAPGDWWGGEWGRPGRHPEETRRERLRTLLCPPPHTHTVSPPGKRSVDARTLQSPTLFLRRRDGGLGGCC